MRKNATYLKICFSVPKSMFCAYIEHNGHELFKSAHDYDDDVHVFDPMGDGLLFLLILLVFVVIVSLISFI